MCSDLVTTNVTGGAGKSIGKGMGGSGKEEKMNVIPRQYQTAYTYLLFFESLGYRVLCKFYLCTHTHR